MCGPGVPSPAGERRAALRAQTWVVTTMTGSEARTYWKALVDNATRLVADAHLLLGAGSAGRATALTVLAQEELGKALWIYEEFSTPWSEGDDTARAVDRLKVDGRRHVQKYLEAMVFGAELATFWGDYSAFAPLENESWDEQSERLRQQSLRQEREAEQAARDANMDKQRGFYVDRDDTGKIWTPTDEAPEPVEGSLRTAAQVIEMLLIKDHSRMKLEASTPYDSTREQQGRLLPISHPEDWAAASPEFRRAASGVDPEQ